jgi:hypothetical protein
VKTGVKLFVFFVNVVNQPSFFEEVVLEKRFRLFGGLNMDRCKINDILLYGIYYLYMIQFTYDTVYI